MANKRKCKQCGERFTAPTGRQIYCSDKCCRDYHNQNTRYERDCCVCGKPFTSKFAKALYCSDECRSEKRKESEINLLSALSYAEMRLLRKAQKAISNSRSNFADFELLEPYDNLASHCRPACPQLGF